MERKEIKERLYSENPVKFSYKKKNGEIRTATGTLNVNVMGEDNAPSGKLDSYNEDTIRYYDLNSEGWRSFLVENFIEFLE